MRVATSLFRLETIYLIRLQVRLLSSISAVFFVFMSYAFITPRVEPLIMSNNKNLLIRHSQVKFRGDDLDKQEEFLFNFFMLK